MKTTATKQLQTETLQPKANKQAGAQQILQRYKQQTAQLQAAEEEELLQGKFETAQRMELDEEEPLQGKFETVQRMGIEEEEPLQGKFETTQLVSEEEELLQGKFATTQLAAEEQTMPAKPNNTGLPDNLKSGIENLSGYSMDDVKVHYNSSQPATLQAHAYAQGTNIHIAPGQEKHLPHEAWHVVQQKQGRVQPTKQLKGKTAINDDAGLENEADVMGAKAMQFVSRGFNSHTIQKKENPISSKPRNGNIIQRNLNTHVLAGSGSGMFNNLFGTSTFSDIRQALIEYQTRTSTPTQKKDALHKMKTLGDKWLNDNSKKADGNTATKRASIKTLLSLVNTELPRLNDNAMLQRESKTFEKNLGLYTFNEGRATDAATGAINKMKQVMGVQANRALAGQVFGGDSAKYAGVVGREVDTVMSAINNGNLREKMTGFYNAALGPFKTMLDDHIKLKGTMSGQTWMAAQAALGGRGINVEGQNAIQERKDQIDSYDTTSSSDIFYIGAKSTGQLDKYKDVYTAPLDPIYRDKDDALKQGQRGVISPEGRMDAMDAALTSSGNYNFNWDLFNYTLADLHGTASGLFDSTSTFKTIQTELGTFLACGNQSNEKIISYKKLKSSTGKWLKDNAAKTDANSDTKRTSLRRLERELQNIYGSSDRTNADLTNGRYSAHLSEREKNFIISQRVDLSMQDNSDNAQIQRKLGYTMPNVYNPNTKLPWEEGGTRFAPNSDNAWTNTAISELKMPVVAGPSGTTDRMLKALNFLGNPVSPLNFRLSLLGWMLTSNDHSFHEIMAVSKSFGLPYEEGSYAYHNIAPLSITDLRQNVCEQRMFPDELVYHSHLNDFILIQDAIDQPKGSFDPKEQYNNLRGTLRQQMSPASAAAISLYTTASYLIQNPTKANSETFAGIKIGLHLADKPELEVLKGKQDANPDQYSIAKLIAEGKVHNAALENALKDLPDTAHNPVYRGQNDGIVTSYTSGQVIRYQKFISTSVHRRVANNFMKAPSIMNTPILFSINATRGKDIGPFSKYPEGEILLMPGTQLRVDKITPNQPANDGIGVIHTQVDCVQV